MIRKRVKRLTLTSLRFYRPLRSKLTEWLHLYKAKTTDGILSSLSFSSHYLHVFFSSCTSFFLSCVNVFQTDLRTALILPVQPCPGLANLSPMPNHLFSITPQTNWSVTPLSGPRLHFSSHPSPPKHSFFFTVTFSASQTPSLSSCVPSMLNCLYLSRLNHISLSLLHTGAHGHTHTYTGKRKPIKYLPTQTKTLVLPYQLRTESECLVQHTCIFLCLRCTSAPACIFMSEEPCKKKQ